MATVRTCRRRAQGGKNVRPTGCHLETCGVDLAGAVHGSFIAEGVTRLVRDKTRKPGKKSLPALTSAAGGRFWRSGRPSQKRPAGLAGRWPRRQASACVRHNASLRPITSRRIASRPSSCRRTRSLPGSSRKSSVSTSPLPPMPSSLGRREEPDRTRPGLPMKPGHAGTMAHDYRRYGTTTVSAALNVLAGAVISRNMRPPAPGVHPLPQHHRVASPKAQSDPGQRHNYATHKHPTVRQWLALAPLNLVLHPDLGVMAQRSRGPHSRPRLQRGVLFRSLDDLKTAINRFLADTNADPKSLRADRRSQPRARGCQTREGKVKVNPLEHDPEKLQTFRIRSCDQTNA